MARLNPEIGEHRLTLEVLERLYHKGARVTLFVRHAKRQPIDPNDPTWGAGALLTEEGELQARALGRALRYYGEFSFMSSPVERCVQTCAYFADGAGIPGPVVVVRSNLLGEPGIYFDGSGRNEVEMRRVGYMPFIFEYIRRGIAMGMRPLAETSEQLLKELRRNTVNRLNLCVTHDIFVAILMDYLKLKVVSPDNWVNYLEGVALALDPSGKVSYAVFNPLSELSQI